MRQGHLSGFGFECFGTRYSRQDLLDPSGLREIEPVESGSVTLLSKLLSDPRGLDPCMLDA